MKCVVPSQNVKVLAKAFHSLGKIGEDLFIEPHKTHLAFRTVNMSESAYASFKFAKTFFSSFTYSEEDSEDDLRCKITMKSLLVVLKSQHGERLLEWCQIRLDPRGTKVIFQLRYSFGCTKTHFLPIIESETLQASYTKDDCLNRLSALPKLLSTAVKNFRTNEDEVTLCLTKQKIILRNHLENNLDSKKALKTEIGLFPAEFEACNIGAPTSVTFCLKELRAVLFFAEFTGLPIHIYLSSAGKPVVFFINNDAMYEADYVVSTLSESGSSQSLSQASESSEATSSRVPSNTRKRPRQESCDEFEKERPVTPQTNNMVRPNCSASEELPVIEEGNVSGFRLLNNSGVSSMTSQYANSLNTSSISNVTQPVVKSVFGRCFNTTFKKQTLPGFDKVLAYDSDGMEDSD